MDRRSMEPQTVVVRTIARLNITYISGRKRRRRPPFMNPPARLVLTTWPNTAAAKLWPERTLKLKVNLIQSCHSCRHRSCHHHSCHSCRPRSCHSCHPRSCCSLGAKTTSTHFSTGSKSTRNTPSRKQLSQLLPPQLPPTQLLQLPPRAAAPAMEQRRLLHTAARVQTPPFREPRPSLDTGHPVELLIF